MAINLENVNQVMINTGNILSLNDITKKPGQNPTEELIEAINITIKDCQSETADNSAAGPLLLINRSNDDVFNKMANEDITDLKIGLKIFVNSQNDEYLREAVEKAFHTLKVGSVQNVIIAYKPQQSDTQVNDIEPLKHIWKKLEEYQKNNAIQQIGLADVEEAAFRQIYEWATIKPSIIQINLATCCVVPPTLQAFCKDHEIQLLTHSDPLDILPKPSIENIFEKPLSVNWVLRYLVHIKCRGVLTTKGYLINLKN